MLIEAIERPIRYRFLDGRQIRLEPGRPVDFPDSQAKALLTKAPDRVRAVGQGSMDYCSVRIESAQCRPVYWESMENRIILGPGMVTDVIKEFTSTGQVQFWLCIAYGDSWRWIHEQLLRSRSAYEAQQRG